jgi:antitoxin (DNA-binding transcriptional repressor) of toxin-antitoxin stability system
MNTKATGIKELQKTVPQAVSAVEGGQLTVVTRRNRAVAVMTNVRDFTWLCAEASIENPIDCLTLGILPPDEPRTDPTAARATLAKARELLVAGSLDPSAVDKLIDWLDTCPASFYGWPGEEGRDVEPDWRLRHGHDRRP